MANKPRAGFGVLVSMIEEPEKGTLKLVMDDAVQDGPSSWRTVRLFTSHEFPQDKVRSTTLSEEQLADVGLAVVARLVALEETSKP